MSLFSRRYGSNRIKCDFYIVEDTPLITGETATENSVYYMYNPDEWLVRIKNLFHGKLPQPTDPELKKLSTVAFAIVTDKYQFLFSPTLAFSETINTLIWDRTNVRASYYSALSTNFNAQYIQGNPNDLLTLINTFNSSLSADDGYHNTQILKSLNWEDEPVSITSSKNNPNPYVTTFEDVYNGPYVISSSVNYTGRDGLPKTNADCLLNMFDDDLDHYPDINADENIPYINGGVRPLRWGMFTDKKGLHINKGDIYVPAINELKVLLKNLYIAIWDKNRGWFGVSGGKYYNPWMAGTYFLPDLNYVYPQGEAFHGYGYYRDIQTWEAIAFGGHSVYTGWWSSTPFQYLLSYDSVKGNRFKANLSFYTPCMNTNLYYLDNTIGHTDNDEIWIMPNQYYGWVPGWQEGLNFSTYTAGYKTPNYNGTTYGGYTVGYYDTFSNVPSSIYFIPCARIPDNVEWGAESVGHPELIRYN